MRRALALATLLALGAAPPDGYELVVAWQAPTNAAEAQVTGYRLYRTPLGSEDAEAIDLGVPEASADGFLRALVPFPRRAVTIWLTTVNTLGESQPSNRIPIPAVATAIEEIRVQLPLEIAR